MQFNLLSCTDSSSSSGDSNYDVQGKSLNSSKKYTIVIAIFNKIYIFNFNNYLDNIVL